MSKISNRKSGFAPSKSTGKKKNKINDIIEAAFGEVTESDESQLPVEINFTIYVDGKKISFKFDKKKPFCDLIDYVQETHFKDIDIDEKYQIFYNNEKLKSTDNRIIAQIITQNDEEKEDVKITFRLLDNSLSNNNIVTNNVYVILENMPSFMDLSEQINNFIQKQDGKANNFNIDYKNNQCKILFPTSEVSFSFVSYMTKLKFTNKFYRKLKVDIRYDGLKRYLDVNSNNKVPNLEAKSLRETSTSSNDENEKNNKLMNKSLINSSNPINKSTNFNQIIKNRKKKNLSQCDEKDDYNNYFEPKYISIQDSIPYGYLEAKKKADRLINKTKWINKKGFFTSANKRTFNNLLNNKYNENLGNYQKIKFVPVLPAVLSQNASKKDIRGKGYSYSVNKKLNKL